MTLEVGPMGFGIHLLHPCKGTFLLFGKLSPNQTFNWKEAVVCDDQAFPNLMLLLTVKPSCTVLIFLLLLGTRSFQRSRD